MILNVAGFAFLIPVESRMHSEAIKGSGSQFYWTDLCENTEGYVSYQTI